jgi:two-component system sensor histidine kinase ResE
MGSSDPSFKPSRFVSLRWRFLLPLFISVLIPAMIIAYALTPASNLEVNVVQTHAQVIRDSLNRLVDAQEYAVRQAAVSLSATSLLLEEIARQLDLDRAIVVDGAGAVQTSLVRTDAGYSADSPVDLGALAAVGEGTGWVIQPDGVFLVSAAPLIDTGTIYAGRSAARVLSELRGTSSVEVVLYNSALTPVAATILDSPPGYVPAVSSIQVAGADYLSAFITPERANAPVGVFMPATALSGVGVTREAAGLMMAALVACVTVVGFAAINWVVNRANRVSEVAEALASGTSTARTGMRPTDEIGAIGAALDRYADYVEQRQDALRLTLRRQRREITHLTSILEMLPDGVVVQDADGHVIFTNDRARELLGSQGLADDATVEEITAVVTDALGPALAPGLYALGNPQQVELNGRMISAQVAAVTSFSNERVGKVAILRDITEEVRRERAREALLRRMTAEVQTPVSEAGSKLVNEPTGLASFAREMSRNAVALQKLIVEMRELSADLDTRSLKRVQRSIPLETLIWALANEWKQIAQAANLKLQVQIERSGLYVLGDERRLRWAIGNLLDNAIKYTPPGGTVTLEIKGEEDGLARLRIRDNGTGIAPEELPQVFTRFYRGNPVTKEGRAIRVPGTGQGLTVTKDIIEAHGGHIQVRSQPGVGTAVYFTLPLTAAAPMELPNAASDGYEDEETTIIEPHRSADEGLG